MDIYFNPMIILLYIFKIIFNQVIASNATYCCLPYNLRVQFARRMASCFSPHWPGGVHLKAIDILESVFTMIGML